MHGQSSEKNNEIYKFYAETSTPLLSSSLTRLAQVAVKHYCTKTKTYSLRANLQCKATRIA